MVPIVSPDPPTFDPRLMAGAGFLRPDQIGRLRLHRAVRAMPVPTPEDLNVVWQLFAQHNLARVAHGLPPFREPDGPLYGVALRFAREIAGTGVLTHTRQSGIPFYTEVDAAEGRQVDCGENAAAGFDSVESVMAAWMGSKGHRANILNSTFNCMCGAYATAANGQTYWVTDFCTL